MAVVDDYEDIGERRVQETYARQYSSGFRFACNCDADLVDSVERSFRERGHDVFVGEKAFHRDGDEDNTLRTILIRQSS